ncbi:uncharacterized protein RJT20DRAFT_58986 [Scheffersomyces xylosifermentans]|uniref:uncharacterized protein n=1 Tax=Scheffersomyces xylosifermentans TaxID=1304137 RepID=UPI00315D61BF
MTAETGVYFLHILVIHLFPQCCPPAPTTAKQYFVTFLSFLPSSECGGSGLFLTKETQNSKTVSSTKIVYSLFLFTNLLRRMKTFHKVKFHSWI